MTKNYADLGVFMIFNLNKNQIYALALLLSLGVSSCQSPEQKAAYAQKAVEAEREQKFKQFVESTPDLYKVTWKVCGNAGVDLNRKINLGCDETKDIPTQGFQTPIYVWGPAGEIKFITKPSFFADISSDSTLFVKSRGCLASGTAKQEQLYVVREFPLKKGSNPQPKDAKIEIVPKQEKEKILRDAVANAQIENATLTNFGVSSNGLIPTGKACQSFDEWKKGN
ncbi:hypothetical protein A4S05_05450 [Nostoc sp. KVJ20]|uniref:hypothetical protein n=1 Tax=Nostoc sp. KVJ20 TaxID=457944 RepID=UPI00086B6AA7|nr:hypothetical protein [Nostoc sp. KVJ20]ODG99170.1 hypothetical protein A4S05_05450 [Nostoc sp. KVJ20]